jgi:ribosomal protein S18 acetylase RimI-like enzyme
MGEPADWYWRDVASFANIWSGYYTDHEPESAFVVVDDGTNVLGYLLGCVDTARAISAERAIRREIVRRQLFFRPGTARFFWRSLADLARDRTVAKEVDDPRYPSHLHIDLLPAARGQGMGRRLMDAWFHRLRAVGSPGCFLGTLAENTAGVAFFESVGFERYGPKEIVPGMRSRDGARMHQQAMVRSV